MSPETGRPPLDERLKQHAAARVEAACNELHEALSAYSEASGGEFNAALLDYYIQRFPEFRDNLNRYAQVQLSSVRATQDEIDAVDGGN